MNAFDSRELRKTLGAFTTGVTVVTTIDSAGNPHGVTANSFSSVSLDPPLILWSQALTSSSYPTFRDAERFVVNILADDQVQVSNQFAKSGIDKFAGIQVSAGIGGVPIIVGSAAHLECAKVAAYPGGDHVVYIGRVDSLHRAPRKPLAFSEGKYMVTFAHDLGGALAGDGQDASLARVEAVRMAGLALADISEQIGQRTVGLAVWGNRGPTIVRWEPSRNPVSTHLQTGVVVSLTQSATGIAFSAFAPAEHTQGLIDTELTAHTPSVPNSDSDFVSKVAEARQHGIARAVGGAPSHRHQVTVNAFSAPVFDSRGEMIMALSTTCRADMLDPDWDGAVPTALRAAASKLSERCGYKPAVPA